MFQFIFISIMFLIGSLAHAGEAGRIVFVGGDARLAGSSVALGAAVQEGDELSTGADGYVYLKTIDEGFLILRPNSRARVAAYHVDHANPANTRVKLELLDGVARSISGKAVKNARQNFRFNTPVAAIGVRGTDFTVFTDQQTSRVTVISGAVVVTGFGGACGPEGSGPCEGAASRELFAEQTGQLLQIQKGQAAPQLLRNNSLAPDAAAPPRGDEPAAKGAAVPPADLNLDPQRSVALMTAVGAQGQPPPPATPPPVIVPPQPPAIPQVIWGRWEKVASAKPDAALLAQIGNGTFDPARVLSSYFIARVKDSALVMPKEGQASFALQSSEVYLQTGSRNPVAANVRNAHLDINFVTRGFTTGLTASAAGKTVEIQAKGDVTLTGELVSSQALSNATVRGYLGGTGAKEAAYIFNSAGDVATRAFGGTQWGRP